MFYVFFFKSLYKFQKNQSCLKTGILFSIYGICFHRVTLGAVSAEPAVTLPCISPCTLWAPPLHTLFISALISAVHGWASIFLKAEQRRAMWRREKEATNQSWADKDKRLLRWRGRRHHEDSWKVYYCLTRYRFTWNWEESWKQWEKPWQPLK